MKRVALYERVSTEEQAKHGYSIEAQSSALKKYAEANNYTIGGEFVDAGISAHIPFRKRPALMEMLSRIDEFDLVLFVKLDRLTRQVKAYYEIMDLMKGTAWKCTNEDYETETASGRFKVNIMLAVAQDEAERTSERIKFVMDLKKEKGQIPTGSIPYGYKAVEHKAVVDEEKAKAVRYAFQEYIATRSLYATQDALKAKFGIFYCPTAIYKWLRNKRYAGDDIYPAIVEAEVFKTVQSINTQAKPRQARKGRQYLFQGMVHCAKCGALLTPRFKGTGATYYVCGRTASRRCDNREMVREDYIEHYLKDNILTFAVSVQAVDNSGEIERLRRKMEKLKDLYLDDLIDKDIYTAEYNAIKKDFDALQNEAHQSLDLNEIKSVLDIYEELTPQNKAKFWHTVIKRIDYADGIFSLY